MFTRVLLYFFIAKTLSFLVAAERSEAAPSEFVVNLKKQTQFQNGQNGAKSVITMVYGDLNDLGQRKNKANSKPNKANLFRIEYCVMHIAKRNLKKQSQSAGLWPEIRHLHWFN